MKRSATIAGVLIRRCLRDPALAAMLVVIPIAGALVFGLADQRANDSLPIGVVHTGDDRLAADLVGQMRDAPELRVRDYADPEALAHAVRRGDIYAGVVVPDDYGARAARGAATDLLLIGDEKQSTFVASDEAVLLIVDRERQAVAQAVRIAGARRESVADALPAARATLNSTPVHTERRTADKLTSATGLGRSVAGMLVFFVFALAMGYATLLVGDRQRGVLARATTTHATVSEIIAGEVGGRTAISLSQGLLIVAISAVFLRVHWGNPVAVIAIVVLFSIVSSSVAVVLGCRLGGSQERLVWLTDGLMALLGVLGGCFFSLQLLPAWVRGLGHAAPHAWAVDAFDRVIATNAGVEAIVVPLLVLAAFAALSFVVAVVQLRRSLGA